MLRVPLFVAWEQIEQIEGLLGLIASVIYFVVPYSLQGFFLNDVCTLLHFAHFLANKQQWDFSTQ